MNQVDFSLARNACRARFAAFGRKILWVLFLPWIFPIAPLVLPHQFRFHRDGFLYFGLFAASGVGLMLFLSGVKHKIILQSGLVCAHCGKQPSYESLDRIAVVGECPKCHHRFYE